MIDDGPTAAGASPAATTATTRRRRAARVGLAVLIVVIGSWTAVRILHLDDPYRPGTTVRTSARMGYICINPGGIDLPGRSWYTDDHAPIDWPQATAAHDPEVLVPGTLRVVADDTGEFTADRGGTLTFHRLRENQFPPGNCFIS
jgi:hypothetical protein